MTVAERTSEQDLVRHRLVVGLICIAAFAGGLAGLSTRSFWLDEAMSLGAARNLVEALVSEGSSMGPYFIILRGASEISTSTWWLRLPSLLFGVAAIAVVDAIGRQIGSRRFALYATATTAGSWMWIRYSQGARGYSMAMFLGAVCWYGLIRSLRRGPHDLDRWWGIYAAASVLMVLTHGLAILVVGAQVLLLGLSPEAQAWARRSLRVLIACLVALVLMVLPGAVVAPQWVQPLSLEQVGQLLQETTGQAW